MENQKTPEEIIAMVKDNLAKNRGYQLNRLETGGWTRFDTLYERATENEKKQIIDVLLKECISVLISSHQEANEINVCFSKPYQKLQRELFEKKKESELFKEVTAKFVEALRISIRHTSELRSLYGSDAGVETIEDIEDNLSTMRELLQTYETK